MSSYYSNRPPQNRRNFGQSTWDSDDDDNQSSNSRGRGRGRAQGNNTGYRGSRGRGRGYPRQIDNHSDSSEEEEYHRGQSRNNMNSPRRNVGRPPFFYNDRENFGNFGRNQDGRGYPRSERGTQGYSVESPYNSSDDESEIFVRNQEWRGRGGRSGANNRGGERGGRGQGGRNGERPSRAAARYSPGRGRAGDLRHHEIDSSGRTNDRNRIIQNRFSSSLYARGPNGFGLDRDRDEGQRRDYGTERERQSDRARIEETERNRNRLADQTPQFQSQARQILDTSRQNLMESHRHDNRTTSASRLNPNALPFVPRSRQSGPSFGAPNSLQPPPTTLPRSSASSTPPFSTFDQSRIYRFHPGYSGSSCPWIRSQGPPLNLICPPYPYTPSSETVSRNYRNRYTHYGDGGFQEGGWNGSSGSSGVFYQHNRQNREPPSESSEEEEDDNDDDDDEDEDEEEDLNFHHQQFLDFLQTTIQLFNSSSSSEPLSKFVLNQLPKWTVHRKSPILASDQKSCIICITDFSEREELLTLPCLHIYHFECIERWFEDHSTCPSCRTEVVIE